MDSPQQIAMRQMHLALLWIASLAVPASRRAEWSHEWRTELWYVLRECFFQTSPNPRSIRAATAFCLGAYQDAIYVRKQSWQMRQPLAQFRGSAAACLVALIGIFFAAWGLARTSTRVALESRGFKFIQGSGRTRARHHATVHPICRFNLLHAYFSTDFPITRYAANGVVR